MEERLGSLALSTSASGGARMPPPRALLSSHPSGKLLSCYRMPLPSCCPSRTDGWVDLAVRRQTLSLLHSATAGELWPVRVSYPAGHLSPQLCPSLQSWKLLMQPQLQTAHCSCLVGYPMFFVSPLYQGLLWMCLSLWMRPRLTSCLYSLVYPF